MADQIQQDEVDADVDDDSVVNEDFSDGEDGFDNLTIKYQTEDGTERRLYHRIDGEVPNIEKMWIQGILHTNTRNVDALLHLLNLFNRPTNSNDDQENEPHRMKYCKVTIIYRESDEEAAQIYSSMLGLLMLRTVTLAVFVEQVSPDICRCLMSGIASPKGVKELVLGITNVRRVLTDEHAQFLADGFAQATSLKDLRIHLWQGPQNEINSNVHTILAAGIAKCLSIRRLFFDVMRESTVCQAPCTLVDTLSREPNNLVRLQLFNGEWDQSQLLLLGNYLGNEDCKLKTLELHQSTFDSFPSNFLRVPNKTVESLTVTETTLSSEDLAPLCSNLSKLKILTLLGNNVDDLSGLDDHLLMRENPTLFFLLVESNKVSERGIVNFAAKLPRMNGLRFLKLLHNPFCQSSHANDVLVNKVLENRSLCHFVMTGLEEHPLVGEVRLCLSLNIAARHGMHVLSANVPIATNLWVHILRRCNDATYRDCTKDPTSEDSNWDESGEHKSEVVFRLLREHAYIFDELH